MSYLDRLTDLETRQRPTDRTDKSTSVGFVSSIPARIERVATETEPAELGRLVTAIYADDIEADPAEALAPALSDPENEPLRNLAIETRRQRVLTVLRENPNVRRAIVVDDEADPHDIIVTMAMRGAATFDMRVPRAKWNPDKFIELIDHCGSTAH